VNSRPRRFPGLVLRDEKCGIYFDRPSVCRGFACKLLTSFERGEVSFGQADAHIQQFFVLKARVDAELAQGEPELLSVPPRPFPICVGEGRGKQRPYMVQIT